MYALVHKDRVLVGPMNWNRALFDGALARIGVSGHVPRLAPDANKLPVVLDAETKIMPARYETPDHNTRIERTYGPYWTFDNDIAVGTYKIKDKEIEFVKADLKNETAAERYKREIAGTTVTVKETEVTLDTTRDGRQIFIQKYMLMGDAETVNWKFPEGWLTLTKAELKSVVDAGAKHIQDQFDWEANLTQTIDSATTLAELDAIVIIEPQEEPTLAEIENAEEV